MTVEISRALKADPTVYSLLGDRIYPNSADIGVEVPYLVFQGMGSDPDNTLDCGAANENSSFQFVVWHDDIKEAERIRLLASKVLEANHFYYTGKHPDNEDAETKLFGRGWDMNWWSER